MLADRQRDSGGFRDLDVYQRGFGLVRPIYELAVLMPALEKYDLASQMRRAAKSIPAEGYALRMDAPKLFCKHLRIAYGSAVEMQVHLDLADELGYGSSAAVIDLRGEYEVLGKMLYRLWQHWRKRLPPGTEDT